MSSMLFLSLPLPRCCDGGMDELPLPACIGARVLNSGLMLGEHALNPLSNLLSSGEWAL